MKRALLGIAVVLSLLVARAASADTQYSDPAGDSGGAPDITSVKVVNDAAGNLTFTVATNQPTLAEDAGLSLWFNADMNIATGDDGVDFVLFVNSNGWEFDRWDGSNYVPAGAPATGLYSNGVLTFKLNKAALGNVARSSSTPSAVSSTRPTR